MAEKGGPLMQLKDIMVREVITMPEEETVLTAARRMRDSNIGCLVITEGKRVLGVITDRDLAVSCVADGHETAKCKLSNHISKPALIADPEMDVLSAAHLMNDKRIKRLPVVDDGQLVGLVSFSDVANTMIQPMLHLLSGLGASRHSN